MLILTRKAGESLYIGDGIKVTVLNIQGKQAKIGITLPDDMTVFREEIYEQVAQENKLAQDSKQEGKSYEIPKIQEIETRIGPIEVKEEQIITFPKGLVGYEQIQSFTLIPFNEESPFYLLQSTTHSELGIIVTDPYMFLDDYSIQISENQQKILQLESSADLIILVTVTVPPNNADQACLNLSGPIFYNTKSRLAMQIPQDVKVSRMTIADCLKNKMA